VGTIDKQLGFVGFGKMAEALWQGFLGAGLVDTEHVSFTETLESRRDYITEKYKLKSLSLNELTQACDVILFCVKPQQIREILEEILVPSGKKIFFLSILAGVPIAFFTRYLGDSTAFLRVMPNTPVVTGHGMTALTFNSEVNPSDRELARALFSSVGQVLELEESTLDAVTGISGSGPAFLYRLADAIAQVGENEGLSYQQAMQLVAQTFIGSGAMLLESGETSDDLISAVASPQGTTEAGLSVMDASKIRLEIRSVFQKAIDRSKEITKEMSRE